MKTIHYLAFLLSLPFAMVSCYEDKGNYNYIDPVKITILLPQKTGTYEVQLGSRITIPVTVESSVPESDLIYEWEIFNRYGSAVNFIKFTEGKSLDYILGPNDLFPIAGSYDIRLKVSIRDSERKSYSDLINITATAMVGLLVIHGDDTQSDIGLVTASEFRINPGTVETKITPDLYSNTNGEKLEGKAVQVIHSAVNYVSTDLCYVIALTDQGGIYADPSALTKLGGLNGLFVGGAEGSLNKGNPQLYYVYGYNKIIIDGGELFVASYGDPFILRSVLSPEYEVSTSLRKITNRSNRFIFFDNSSKGFIELNSFLLNNMPAYPMSVNGGMFDPGNMKADLLYFDRGGRFEHFMGVFENETGRFVAEFDFENSEIAGYPYAKYETTNLPDFNNAIFHAFGDSQINMCYYASSSKIYRYAADGGSPTGEVLKTQTGTPIDISGEITMMKMLKPDKTGPYSYHNYNKVLLVGTYAGGMGTLHSFIIDESTGLVTSSASYPGFDRITDANLKGL